MTQGQGKHTAAKIAGFEAALRQNVAIVANGIRAQHYFHFDMNAVDLFDK